MDKKIYNIDEIKKMVEPVVQKHGVKQLSIFGSYAKGNASSQSDIDFHLMKTGDLWGYFKLLGFKQDLENCLGVNVDVLTTGAMDSEVFNEVRKSEVLIYG
ncbi:MAG: nucleotidyltransferase domain-containing protein [Defluviitaleaceae bacterium]|nr:nucleotidyltransferase domain-containing protein [Defluviitaleaceae bacterium]